MTTVTTSEARATLPELLRRVEAGAEITVTRHGRPVAVLVSPATLRSRRASPSVDDADRIHDLLAEAGANPLPSAGVSVDRADELVRLIRAGRDRA